MNVIVEKKTPRLNGNLHAIVSAPLFPPAVAQLDRLRLPLPRRLLRPPVHPGGLQRAHGRREEDPQREHRRQRGARRSVPGVQGLVGGSDW